MTTILIDAFGDAQFTRGHDVLSLSDKYADAEMRRVTEIHMDSTSRRFFIEWKVRLALDGIEYVRRGEHHSMIHHRNIFGLGKTPKPEVRVCIEHDSVLTFDTYEDAVKYEVSCINEMRKQGVIFP